MSLNCAVIIGRLTANPELRTTNSGVAVTSIRVAVDRDYVKPGEERQADFINVVAWRGTAAFIERYFKKGQLICVQGSLQSRNYEDKDGNKRVAVEIVASSVSFCGYNKVEAAQNSEPIPQDYTVLPIADDVDDRLPF